MNSFWVKSGRFWFRYRGMLLPMAVILYLLPSPPLLPDPAVAGVIGLVIALFGQTIRSANVGLDYIIRGGKDHQVYAEKLVTGGIYNHVRNPMYVGNMFLVAGMAVASNAWVFLVAGITIVVVMHVSIIAAEEDFLRTKFGASFDEFCARTPRWIPKLTGLLTTIRSCLPFNWRRMLVKEYQKTVDWLVALAVIVLINLWRAHALDKSVVVATLMVVVIVVRIALHIAARVVAAQEKAASADQ